MSRRLRILGDTGLVVSFIIFCFWLDAVVDPYLFESITHYWVSGTILFLSWTVSLLITIGLLIHGNRKRVE